MNAQPTRLGVTIPSPTVVIEPEFNNVAPDGVTCHFQRFPSYGGTRCPKGIRSSKDLTGNSLPGRVRQDKGTILAG